MVHFSRGPHHRLSLCNADLLLLHVNVLRSALGPLSAEVAPNFSRARTTHIGARRIAVCTIGEKLCDLVDGLIALRASNDRRQIRIAHQRNEDSIAESSNTGGGRSNIQTAAVHYTAIWIREQIAESGQGPGHGHVERSYLDAVLPGQAGNRAQCHRRAGEAGNEYLGSSTVLRPWKRAVLYASTFRAWRDDGRARGAVC